MDFRRPVVIERDPAAAVPGTGTNASNSNSNSNSQPANASGATAAPLASDSVAPSGESALREEAKMLALKKRFASEFAVAPELTQALGERSNSEARVGPLDEKLLRSSVRVDHLQYRLGTASNS